VQEDKEQPEMELNQDQTSFNLFKQELFPLPIRCLTNQQNHHLLMLYLQWSEDFFYYLLTDRECNLRVLEVTLLKIFILDPCFFRFLNPSVFQTCVVYRYEISKAFFLISIQPCFLCLFFRILTFAKLFLPYSKAYFIVSEFGFLSRLLGFS